MQVPVRLRSSSSGDDDKDSMGGASELEGKLKHGCQPTTKEQTDMYIDYVISGWSDYWSDVELRDFDHLIINIIMDSG